MEEAVEMKMMQEEGAVGGDLLSRLKIFVRDLLTFSSDSGAMGRLAAADPTPHAFYMSAPYFSREEAHRLLFAPPHMRRDQAVVAADLRKQHTTLHDALQDMQRCKAEKGEVHLCTSHDLAPVIQGWFGIRKGFQEDPQFKKDLKLFLKKHKQQQGRWM